MEAEGASNAPSISRYPRQRGQRKAQVFLASEEGVLVHGYKEGKKTLRLTIGIDAAKLHESRVSEAEPVADDTTTGTIVEFAPLKDTFDWLTSEAANAEFATIFAPYILQYPGTEVIYNGHPVDPSLTIDLTKEFGTRKVVKLPRFRGHRTI
jgi:hypothetical protein